MLIPRFWSRADGEATTPDGRRVRFHTWRGSRVGAGEAEAAAREAVERIGARIRQGQGFPERYAYSDRPLREEVLREIPGPGAGDPDAALTRNTYGAVVLNAARVFFIDVDVAPAGRERRAHAGDGDSPLASAVHGLLERYGGALPPVVRSIVEGVFGRAAAAVPDPGPAAAPAGAGGPALDGLRRWVAAHPEWRVRVYRTHSGLRYLVTHAPFTPADAAAREAMTALGADPQYVRLCAAQKSFRARLTPKPWRVGVENPPARFPYESPGEERALREWVVRYDRASEGHATCTFVEELGGGSEHPDVTPLLRLHDEQTLATSGLPLA